MSARCAFLFLSFSGPRAMTSNSNTVSKAAAASGRIVTKRTQTVHVGIWDILGPSSRYMGTPLGAKYIPYTYMDPLG